jgi:hypothetical protein
MDDVPAGMAGERLWLRDAEPRPDFDAYIMLDPALVRRAEQAFRLVRSPGSAATGDSESEGADRTHGSGRRGVGRTLTRRSSNPHELRRRERHRAGH